MSLVGDAASGVSYDKNRSGHGNNRLNAVQPIVYYTGLMNESYVHNIQGDSFHTIYFIEVVSVNVYIFKNLFTR